MAAADLVVARAGGSVAELAALGRPAVLVPYPYATADHQRKNAEWMAAAGAAVLVADAELDGARLARLVARAARRPDAARGDGGREPRAPAGPTPRDGWPTRSSKLVAAAPASGRARTDHREKA